MDKVIEDLSGRLGLVARSSKDKKTEEIKDDEQVVESKEGVRERVRKPLVKK